MQLVAQIKPTRFFDPARIHIFARRRLGNLSRCLIDLDRFGLGHPARLDDARIDHSRLRFRHLQASARELIVDLSQQNRHQPLVAQPLSESAQSAVIGLLLLIKITKYHKINAHIQGMLERLVA